MAFVSHSRALARSVSSAVDKEAWRGPSSFVIAHQHILISIALHSLIRDTRICTLLQGCPWRYSYSFS